MAKIKDILGMDYLEQLQGEGKSDDEIIAIAKQRHALPSLNLTSTPKPQPKSQPKPTPLKAYAMQDGVGPSLVRGLGESGVRTLSLINWGDDEAYDKKLDTLSTDLERKKDEVSQADLTPERRQEIADMRARHDKAEGLGENLMAGVEALGDIVTHPEEITLQGAVATAADPLNLAGFGAGGLAARVGRNLLERMVVGAGAGALEGGTINAGGEYAIAKGRGKSEEEALKIAQQSAAPGALVGAGMGALGGVASHGKTSEAGSNYEAAYADLGVNDTPEGGAVVVRPETTPEISKGNSAGISPDDLKGPEVIHDAEVLPESPALPEPLKKLEDRGIIIAGAQGWAEPANLDQGKLDAFYGEQIANNRLGAIVVEAEKRAASNDAEIKLLTQRAVEAGAPPEAILEIPQSVITFTDDDIAMTKAVNDGKMADISILDATVKLGNTIKLGNRTPKQIYDRMRQWKFNESVSAAYARAYQSQDETLALDYSADKLSNKREEIVPSESVMSEAQAMSALHVSEAEKADKAVLADTQEIAKEYTKDTPIAAEHDKAVDPLYTQAYDALDVVESKRAGTQNGFAFEGEQNALFDTEGKTELKVPKWAKPLVSDTTRYEDIVTAVTEAKNGTPSPLADRALKAMQREGLVSIPESTAPKLESLQAHARYNEALDFAKNPHKRESTKLTQEEIEAYHGESEDAMNAAHRKNFEPSKEPDYGLSLSKAGAARIEKGKPWAKDLENLQYDLDRIEEDPLFNAPDTTARFEELKARRSTLDEAELEEFYRLYEEHDPKGLEREEASDLFGDFEEEQSNDTSGDKNLEGDRSDGRVQSDDTEDTQGKRGGDLSEVSETRGSDADSKLPLQRSSGVSDRDAAAVSAPVDQTLPRHSGELGEHRDTAGSEQPRGGDSLGEKRGAPERSGADAAQESSGVPQGKSGRGDVEGGTELDLMVADHIQEKKNRTPDPESSVAYSHVFPFADKLADKLSELDTWYDGKVDAFFDRADKAARGLDRDGNLKPPQEWSHLKPLQKVTNWIQENFVNSYGRPDSYLETLSKFEDFKTELADNAVKTKQALGNLTEVDSQQLVRALGGDIDLRELPKGLTPIYEKFRKEIDANTRELIAEGMLDPQYAKENYLKRYYFKEVEPDGEVRKRGIKNEGKYKRSEMTLQERIDAGQIEDASYVVAKTILEQGEQLALGRFFQRLSDEVSVIEGYPGYSKIPNITLDGGIKQYGALSGKWIPDAVFEDVTGAVGMRSGLDGTVDFIGKYVGHIKSNMTIKNMGTHLYNAKSNLFMAYLDGHMLQLGKVLYDSHYRNTLLAEAKKNGVNTMLDDIEIPEFKKQSNENSVVSILKTLYLAEGTKMGDFARTAYAWEDKIFKLAAYAKRREALQFDTFLEQNPDLKTYADKGVRQRGEIEARYSDAISEIAPEASKLREAFKAVGKEVYVDYSTPLAKGVKNLDRLGIMPFMHYTWKSTPLVAKQVIKHPMKLALLHTVLAGFGASAWLDSGEGEEEYLKRWMNSGGWNLLGLKNWVEVSDKEEREGEYYNLGRAVPGMRFVDKGLFGFLLGFDGGILANLIGISFIGVNNRGYRIDGGENEEGVVPLLKRASAVSEVVMPPMFPSIPVFIEQKTDRKGDLVDGKYKVVSIGGRYFQKATAALGGKEDRYKDPLLISDVAKQAAGIKLERVDKVKEAQSNLNRYYKAFSKASKIARTPQAKKSAIEVYKKHIAEVKKQLPENLHKELKIKGTQSPQRQGRSGGVKVFKPFVK